METKHEINIRRDGASGEIENNTGPGWEEKRGEEKVERKKRWKMRKKVRMEHYTNEANPASPFLPLHRRQVHPLSEDLVLFPLRNRNRGNFLPHHWNENLTLKRKHRRKKKGRKLQRGGNLKEFVRPALKWFKRFVLVDIRNKHAAISTTIEGDLQRLKSLWTRSGPNLWKKVTWSCAIVFTTTENILTSIVTNFSSIITSFVKNLHQS